MKQEDVAVAFFLVVLVAVFWLLGLSLGTAVVTGDVVWTGVEPTEPSGAD